MNDDPQIQGRKRIEKSTKSGAISHRPYSPSIFLSFLFNSFFPCLSFHSNGASMYYPLIVDRFSSGSRHRSMGVQSRRLTPLDLVRPSSCSPCSDARDMLCWWYSTSRCTFPCKSTGSFLPGWRGRGPDLGCNDRSNARLVYLLGSGHCS